MPRVYVTSTYGEARYRVCRVNHPGEADLCVLPVSTWGLAYRDAYWFFTNKQDADLWIFYDTFGASQLRICFVDSYGMSGWQNPHSLKGRLHN